MHGDLQRLCPGYLPGTPPGGRLRCCRGFRILGHQLSSFTQERGRGKRGGLLSFSGNSQSLTINSPDSPLPRDRVRYLHGVAEVYQLQDGSRHVVGPLQARQEIADDDVLALDVRVGERPGLLRHDVRQRHQVGPSDVIEGHLETRSDDYKTIREGGGGGGDTRPN